MVPEHECRRGGAQRRGARALPIAAGQADSAIAQYEQLIATRYYNRLVEVDPLALALAHERLGELYEARSGDARAAAHDQRFIASWATPTRIFSRGWMIAPRFSAR